MDIQQILLQAGIGIANQAMREWQADFSRLRESLFTQPISYAASTEEGLPPLDPSKMVEGSIVEPVTDPTRLIGTND